GGEQQMLAVARALLERPRILLLDEPSMGLAPLVVKRIFSLLEEIRREGTTLLLVEQNARMALSFSDYAYVLERGQIALQGSARDLAADARVQAARRLASSDFPRCGDRRRRPDRAIPRRRDFLPSRANAGGRLRRSLRATRRFRLRRYDGGHRNCGFRLGNAGARIVHACA